MGGLRERGSVSRGLGSGALFPKATLPLGDELCALLEQHPAGPVNRPIRRASLIRTVLRILRGGIEVLPGEAFGLT